MNSTIFELTQGMAEKFIDNIPDAKLPMVRYQGAFVQTAIEAGWVKLDGEVSDLPRAELVKIFWQIRRVWEEANAVPNASSSPQPDGPTARELSPTS